MRCKRCDTAKSLTCAGTPGRSVTRSISRTAQSTQVPAQRAIVLSERIII